MRALNPSPFLNGATVPLLVGHSSHDGSCSGSGELFAPKSGVPEWDNAAQPTYLQPESTERAG